MRLAPLQLGNSFENPCADTPFMFPLFLQAQRILYSFLYNDTDFRGYKFSTTDLASVIISSGTYLQFIFIKERLGHYFLKIHDAFRKLLLTLMINKLSR
jgi:hypothetical protein